mmetsp:Transcript_45869/g.143911  ORF Transcript_45869/g.143911 Transcript_45869/m.143911 type:complete len:411 (-) Transcript_45869:40-1272(-)
MDPSTPSQLDQPGMRGSIGSALLQNVRINRFTVGDQEFELPDKYIFERDLGKGAYGFVCCCRVQESGEQVAVKKVKILDEITEARRVFREIKILRNLSHVNVLAISEIFAPMCYEDFTAVFIVTDFYPADLSQIIRSPQQLTDVHVQTFMYQLLRGLKYIHSANVLHRDLKPNNILVNRDCDLAICDFGLARMTNESDMDKEMTQYVVTRWYRAPELIMLAKDYTSAIDIWSAGCIMAELLSRRPLFPGADYVKQLEYIINYLGTPTKEDLEATSGNERASKYAASLGNGQNNAIPHYFQHCNPMAVDLLCKMLTFNPKNRITAVDALEHPYLSEVRDRGNEPVASSPLNVQEFEEVEKSDISYEQVKRMIWEEVQRFHDQQRRQSQEAAAMQAFKVQQMIAGEETMSVD